jgi:hypothetical protein
MHYFRATIPLGRAVYSSGKSLASHRCGPGSSPGCHVGFVVDKVALDRFSPSTSVLTYRSITRDNNTNRLALITISLLKSLQCERKLSSWKPRRFVEGVGGGGWWNHEHSRYHPEFEIRNAWLNFRSYCNVDGQSGVFTVPCRADPTRPEPGRAGLGRAAACCFPRHVGCGKHVWAALPWWRFNSPELLRNCPLLGN